jgi:FkbM family methyltransferase
MGQLRNRAHNVRSMLSVASGLRGKRAVMQLLANRGGTNDDVLAVPMKALGGESLYVRPGTSDSYNATWYYLDGLHRPPSQLDGPIDVICEIGSNIGAALTALGTDFPEAQLLGVEPDPGNVAVLRRNTERFGTRCTIVHRGVWDSESTLTVEHSHEYGEHGATTSVAGPDSGTRNIVRASTLDAILDEFLPGQTVDYMHVSAEGAEPHVFASGQWPQRVRGLRVELHPYANFGFAECAARLTELGYAVEADPSQPEKWANAVRA